MNIREYLAVFSACLTAISNSIGTQAAGARLVSELNPGAVGSYPSNFTHFGGNLYFSAYTQSNGFELWHYNGTSVSLAAEVNPTVDDLGFGVKEGNDSVPVWLTALGGYLYFSAFEPRRGTELWRFDGTQAERVSDLNPDADDSIKFNPSSSWPKELTVLNSVLYFSATSRTNPENYELWQYDGATVSQTANLHPDIGADHSSYPNGLTAFNGALYFMADNGTNGWELYRQSGSTTTLIDINPGGPESSAYPKYFTAFGTSLYFQAYTAEAGFELWRTDGGEAMRVADLNPGAASSYPEGFTVFQGALYFSGNNGTCGAELQRFDGASVTLAADINPAGDAYPKNLFVFGDWLVFSADDGVHGWELWKFDGATATLITNLNAAGDAFPQNLTISGGALYFTATTPETGYEVFKFDGTSVTLAGDINPGPGDSFPRFLRDFNDQLFFSAADNGTSNWELWVVEEGANSNAAPTVSITARQMNQVLLAPATVNLEATASDQDGTVVRVEFFKDQQSIGSDPSAPFELEVGNLPAGTHRFTAITTDHAGASGASAMIEVKVVDQPAITSIRRTGTSIDIHVAAPDDQTVILESSADLVNWEFAASSGSVSGIATFNQALDTFAFARFYRATIQ